MRHKGSPARRVFFAWMWMTLLATNCELLASAQPASRHLAELSVLELSVAEVSALEVSALELSVLELSSLELSSRAIFLRAECEERLSRDLASCWENAATARTNPDPSACPHRASAARDGARDDSAWGGLRLSPRGQEELEDRSR
jgi:hypothetical protein